MDDPKKWPRLLTLYERWSFVRGSNYKALTGKILIMDLPYGRWLFTRGGHTWKFNSITMPCKIQVQHSEFHKQAMR